MQQKQQHQHRPASGVNTKINEAKPDVPQSGLCGIPLPPPSVCAVLQTAPVPEDTHTHIHSESIQTPPHSSPRAPWLCHVSTFPVTSVSPFISVVYMYKTPTLICNKPISTNAYSLSPVRMKMFTKFTELLTSIFFNYLNVSIYSFRMFF